MLLLIWVHGHTISDSIFLEVIMDTTGKFFAFIGVCVTIFLSAKGIQGMIKEQEDKMQEARDDGMRAAQRSAS